MSLSKAFNSALRHMKNGDLIETMLALARERREVETVQRQVSGRRLAEKPGLSTPTQSARRLNVLAGGMPRCSTYLEVGVQAGFTFENVEVPFRWGVDPVPNFRTAELPHGAQLTVDTSDAFFQGLQPNHYFDLVFLDGLHEWRQTYRDLLNTLEHTTRGALILMDDVVPDDSYSAMPNCEEALAAKRAAGITDDRWQGDVYKTLLAIIKHHPNLEFRVIGDAAVDNLQAIIWRTGQSSVQPPSDLSLAAIDRLTYSEVFPNGSTPESFRHMDEEPGLRDALEAIAHIDSSGYDPHIRRAEHGSQRST